MSRQTAASSRARHECCLQEASCTEASFAFIKNVSCSTPLALKGEGGPVVWRAPAPALKHLDLRTSERRGGSLAALQHLRIKPRHQFGGRAVVDVPEADYYACRARVH